MFDPVVDSSKIVFFCFAFFWTLTKSFGQKINLLRNLILAILVQGQNKLGINFAPENLYYKILHSYPIIIYIYKRLRPRKKIRNRKKERAARAIFFNEIEHQAKPLKFQTSKI
jgi:hypothetical protein